MTWAVFRQVIMRIANDKIGRVIGKEGSTINRIRQVSQAITSLGPGPAHSLTRGKGHGQSQGHLGCDEGLV